MAGALQFMKDELADEEESFPQALTFSPCSIASGAGAERPEVEVTIFSGN